ncbi:glutamyl-tRNA amidotransferase [Candidatus Roizmanbacteria bacterium CG11_big_fil_rev_8_21_14_0_20_37_16]|uniref:Glutamyl-tRNA amidotransferase n=1 Tax=Candidatus Roizmanbacteria bacterium CG11_big_fil_rev_8_21_14_0_20_37_16 TaxID=1974857 RepID=A0A2H0KKX7_9BACT|nr:MAG: glutamyl-tRNA amidotransferase [Candidatus Roizmanbacteria bacterium CG11_big_fil_rev_8_21_14_0_20_37_16]
MSVVESFFFIEYNYSMLYEQLQAEQITALKTKDTLKLLTLRGIIAQIKNKEIDKGSALTEDEVMAVMRKTKKELLESIESFTKGGRTDLTEESQKQLVIVSSYLPPELTEEELEKEVHALIDANTEAIAKNPKAIIGICMKELKDKAESSRILVALQKVQ